jgi:hypothetical protein
VFGTQRRAQPCNIIKKIEEFFLEGIAIPPNMRYVACLKINSRDESFRAVKMGKYIHFRGFNQLT